MLSDLMPRCKVGIRQHMELPVMWSYIKMTVGPVSSQRLSILSCVLKEEGVPNCQLSHFLLGSCTMYMY